MLSVKLIFLIRYSDQQFENLLPTLNVEAGCGLLVSTHTAVVSTVFCHHFIYQEFIHTVLLHHLILFSRLQDLRSLFPLNSNSGFREFTAQTNAGSLLSFLALQLLFEGRRQCCTTKLSLLFISQVK